MHHIAGVRACDRAGHNARVFPIMKILCLHGAFGVHLKRTQSFAPERIVIAALTRIIALALCARRACSRLCCISSILYAGVLVHLSINGRTVGDGCTETAAHATRGRHSCTRRNRRALINSTFQLICNARSLHGRVRACIACVWSLQCLSSALTGGAIT